jgi:hypothetical protein
MRTTLGKALTQWRGDLILDLGGTEAVTTQQLAIVDLAVKTKLILDSIDAWCFAQPTLINRRRRSLLPVVKERQQLADSLAKYMAMLGLERRVKPIPSLGDYVASRYSNDGAHTSRESVTEREEDSSRATICAGPGHARSSGTGDELDGSPVSICGVGLSPSLRVQRLTRGMPRNLHSIVEGNMKKPRPLPVRAEFVTPAPALKDLVDAWLAHERGEESPNHINLIRLPDDPEGALERARRAGLIRDEATPPRKTTP